MQYAPGLLDSGEEREGTNPWRGNSETEGVGEDIDQKIGVFGAEDSTGGTNGQAAWDQE